VGAGEGRGAGAGRRGAAAGARGCRAAVRRGWRGRWLPRLGEVARSSAWPMAARLGEEDGRPDLARRRHDGGMGRRRTTERRATSGEPMDREANWTSGHDGGLQEALGS
jgi:hypothetical protein